MTNEMTARDRRANEMTALVKARPEPGLWMETRPVPEIGPDDVLIRVNKTGICGTDIHIWNWDDWARRTVPVPLVTGHEFAGVVVEVGRDVTDIAIGQRCSGEGHLIGKQSRQSRAGKFHLDPDTRGIGVNEPGAFAEYLRSHPNVAHVHAVSDVVKRLNKNLHGDDPAYEVIPDSRELVAQLLLFYELSVPFGQDLTTQIDLTKSASKLTASLVHVSSAQIRAIGADAEAWMKANTPDIYSPATGLSMAYAYLSKTNVEAMIDGTFVAPPMAIASA